MSDPTKLKDLIPPLLQTLNPPELTVSPELEKKPNLSKLATNELKKISLGSIYETFEETKIRELKTIKAWLKLFLSGTKKGAVFTGDLGTGKTTLLHWIAYNLLLYTPWQYIKNYPELIPTRGISIALLRTSNLTRAFVQQDKETIEIAQTIPVLMLDDFTRHYQHDFPTSMLEDLIEYRYANQLPTFVTLDLSLQSLAQEEKKWGRILDRFRESKWMYGALSLGKGSQRI